ncbi:PREDICTED: ras and EF-hand domain-containing protein isoform X2 [Chinchilla lanigera]|uniref:ras and EF-hand domain-containing protein isoform X2 n=1 Tax=Chinchilla lanigera TaxID=34839 RepID=UPI000697329A|nr:PREDICTED: ras and EF-hand domain-containing protein isoform X2 [Chinchilla lanigera]
MDQRIQSAKHKTRKQREEELKPINQKEDVTALKEQIYDLSVENQKLKNELLEAQTNIAFLRSKLSALKCDYADHSLNPKSLPQSCFRSHLYSVRESIKYDSQMEFKHQREFQSSHGGQESSGGDASDTDVFHLWDEETSGTKGAAPIVDWQPPRCVSGGSTVTSSRKLIPALSSQEDKKSENPKASRSQKVYKIVLAGDAAVGKTSFLMRLCKNEFRGDISATVGVDCKMKTLIVDGEETVLQLWDTAGLERFGIISKSYFRKASGVLLLYDVTCERSFLNVREWLTMIEDASTQVVPIMLVGNKSDLRATAASEGQKCMPSHFGENLARTYGALFCETSAKDGSNVVETVLHLAREVKKRTEEEADSKAITILAGISSKESAQRKNCCNA